MNYADELNLCLELYPRLFIDEVDVLHHLFAVIGNGYTWVNGELDGGNVETIKLQAKQSRDSIEESRSKGKENLPPYYGKTTEETRKMEYESRLRWIKEDEVQSCWFLLPDGRIGHKLYPICEYSKLMTIPGDIKKDWLDAAIKALNYFKSDLFKRTEKDDEWLDKAEIKIGNLK